jgi:hypothetical protein
MRALALGCASLNAMQIDSPTVVATHPAVAELDRLGDEIAELSAHLDAATARLLERIRQFDARGGWNNGFQSCAHWLSWRVGLDLGAARERVRVAHALGTLPRLAEALARGELSYAKVRALTRVATPETEARLLAVGRAGTSAHVERIVRGWRRADRLAEAREEARQHAGRGLHVVHDEDGEGYQVACGPDGTFQFRRPDGRALPEVPPPVAVPGDPVKKRQATNEARQLRIHARTACPSWLGERLDVGWAVAVLHPRAAAQA